MRWALLFIGFLAVGCSGKNPEYKDGVGKLGLEAKGAKAVPHTPPNASDFPEGLQFIKLIPPRHLADSLPFPARNPLSVEGIALGKKLFFDPLLSANNRLSCASCHHPDKVFSDAIALTDRGVSGKRLKRHVPALMNLAWHPTLFWDGGARDLESLTFGPLTHPDEMGQDLNALVHELNAHPEYPRLFSQVFGDSIRSAYIARALAQYQRTFITAQSPYDRWMLGDSSALNREQVEGHALFQQHCAACHPAPFFTDFAYHNNGLDRQFPTEWEHEGQGRYRITLKDEDLGTFKTPSLRNITRTAPYMHDGRFSNLQAVLDHYTQGIQPSPTLDTLLAEGIPLSQQEQAAILAFLEALGDERVVQ